MKQVSHRDSLKASKGKRSFGIKLTKKPHKRWPECLQNLRIKFDTVDINDVDLEQLNIYGNTSNPIHPRRKKLESSDNPFDESVADKRKEVEEIDLIKEDESFIDGYRRGHVICDFDTPTFDIDITMPNMASVTLPVNGMKRLVDIKPEAILQAKRFVF